MYGDNFGMGYPPELAALLQPQTAAAPTGYTDAFSRMNGGGYMGGIVNAPMHATAPGAGYLPTAGVDPASADAAPGVPGSGPGAFPGQAAAHVPSFMADRFASFFQNGPGFSGYNNAAPSTAMPQQAAGLGAFSGPTMPQNMPSPAAYPWGGAGRKPGGWSGWGG